MGDPLSRRDRRIELGGLPPNQEEPVQVAPVHVEKHDVECFNRTLLLQSTQVLPELVEMARTHLFSPGN
jgi:hypothetical protein